jgi:transcriptional regulator with XRE-family HTH domain
VGGECHNLELHPADAFTYVRAMSGADYPYAEIGERLRKLRRALGFSNTDFARMHNWGQTQLTNWETGHRRITVEAATKLRDRYQVTLDWIYLGVESSLPQNLVKSLAAIDSERS